MFAKIFKNSRRVNETLISPKCSYSVSRRRGDGSKKDIYEEKSSASQEEYFRQETQRQLQEILDKLEDKDKADSKNKKIDGKNNNNKEKDRDDKKS